MFSRVRPEGRERLETISRLCSFRKGELIFRDGDPCPGVYVVGSGLVRVFKTGAGGKEHVLHMVGPGHTFAEVAAIADFPCPASAEAVAPSTCILLPADLFRQALAQSHQLCLDMMGGMAFWVRHLVGLMEDIVLRDAAGRLARYLLQSPTEPDGTIELPTLKRHLASHLNLTSETFSRTLGRMIEGGMLVELDGNRLEIRDRGRLVQLAEGLP
jgi:CRP/FNR family transcriptional regulator, dissimilatory nitrate respiration regulator